MSKIDELIDKYYKRGDWIFVEELKSLKLYIELAEVTIELETLDFSSNALAGYGEPPSEEDYTNAARYTVLEQRYYELINKIKEQE